MASTKLLHKNLITIGKPIRCEGSIERLHYGRNTSDYVICPECMTVFYMPQDETLFARPMKKAIGRLPTKPKELPKLGRPFKKKRGRRKKAEEEPKKEG